MSTRQSLDSTAIGAMVLVCAVLGIQQVALKSASNEMAPELGVLAFMSPIFGVAFGVILLNEPLETRFLFGCTLVIVGVLLVTASPLFIRKPSA